MGQKKIDWSFVLSLKEFNQYLNYSDTLANSQTSKYIRAKLRPRIFKNVNINEIVNILLKDVTLNSSFLDKSEALSSKFGYIQQFVHSIQFDISTELFFVPVIVNCFEFVSSLVIDEFIMPFSIARTVFSSLERIHSLNINYCLILFPPDCSEVEYIHLPLSIASLDLTQIAGLSTPEYSNTEKFIDNQAEDDPNTTSIDLRFTTYLPKLIKLRFAKGNTQDQTVLMSFIQHNNQLKFIEIHIDQLTTDVYNCLLNCQNLKSVVIHRTTGIYEVLEFESYPILPSVEKLSLCQLLRYSDSILNYITAPFINIKHLSISNMSHWSGQLHLIIQKFTKLEKLTVYCAEGYEVLDDFMLTSKTLKILKFKQFLDYRFELSILHNCPNIYRVKFDTKLCLSNNLSNLIFELQKSTNFKILKFENSINCYKLN